MDITKEIVTKMAEARKAQGLSLRELARRADVGFRSLYNWEHGANKITVDAVDKVLRALGISVVIGGSKENGPNPDTESQGGR